MKKILLAILLVLAMAFAAQAADVTLAWDPNTEPDLAGYRIYMSIASGTYDKAVDKVADIAVGTETATVAVLPEDGRAIYFVATAYDTSGNESGFSNEVSWQVPDVVPPAEPKDFRLVVNMTKQEDGSYALAFRFVPTKE